MSDEQKRILESSLWAIANLLKGKAVFIQYSLYSKNILASEDKPALGKAYHSRTCK